MPGFLCCPPERQSIAQSYSADRWSDFHRVKQPQCIPSVRGSRRPRSPASAEWLHQSRGSSACGCKTWRHWARAVRLSTPGTPEGPQQAVWGPSPPTSGTLRQQQPHLHAHRHCPRPSAPLNGRDPLGEDDTCMCHHSCRNLEHILLAAQQQQLRQLRRLQQVRPAGSQQAGSSAPNPLLCVTVVQQ